MTERLQMTATSQQLRSNFGMILNLYSKASDVTVANSSKLIFTIVIEIVGLHKIIKEFLQIISTIAKSVYSELGKWSALDKIQAMSFDKTVGNTGRIKEQAVFSLFDDSLSNCVKKRVATKLISQANEDEELDDYCDMKPLIKINEVSEILDKNVDHFISSQSKLWSNNEEYLKSKKIVDGLKVTNDTAERGVKLITDYKSCITKEEDQKQYLLQVIAECRTKFPCCSKASLSESLLLEQ
ncbi:hypothetical protein HELRODRAFT_184215 [Helobdella robusta]|uniref:Uncharacterized protein n=1 Tax=Helobdella robusta TaxID=6412 RepID=T1FKS3_HELRO|nr:hypothetical protein HELRODRAFT_184215 [Helobdella robusta]ESO05134.1 hypothetical protein HELRODRAFT_184215 [Helobdella robusta]